MNKKVHRLPLPTIFPPLPSTSYAHNSEREVTQAHRDAIFEETGSEGERGEIVETEDDKRD
jgi:hypothetical protein